jgi:hypothetical protein
MTTMTPERFARIVDAYGADPRRWPDDERAAACAFAQAHPREAQQRLAVAGSLDAGLDADVVEAASRALQHRIVASAPAPSRARTVKARPARWWLSGAALAGAGVAGLAAGAMAMSLLMTMSEHPAGYHEPSYLSTGFDATVGEGSIE